MTNYRSPFGDPKVDDHNGPDALCLSRGHCADAVEDTLTEFHRATRAVIDAGIGQPAFFLARQTAELGLKSLLHPDPPAVHDLTALLSRLADRGDDLLAGGPDQQLIVAFVRDLARHDERGDQGRYPMRTNGELSLATVCCADPIELRLNVDRLHTYIQGRIIAGRQVTAASASAI